MVSYKLIINSMQLNWFRNKFHETELISLLTLFLIFEPEVRMHIIPALLTAIQVYFENIIKERWWACVGMCGHRRKGRTGGGGEEEGATICFFIFTPSSSFIPPLAWNIGRY